MTRYRKTRNLTPIDAAYIAGLVDGEGTISLTRRHRDENRHLVVSISSTELSLLRHVLKTVGAGRITNKRSVSIRHTPSATYTIDNRQALRLLEQIAHHLRTYKVRRAELVLRDYLRLTPRNGKYSQALRKQRDAFVRTFFALTSRE